MTIASFALSLACALLVTDDPWTEAHKAIQAGRFQEAVDTVDAALELLPVDHPTWPYLMERAAEAENLVGRYGDVHARLARISEAWSGEDGRELPTALVPQLQHHRAQAYLRAGLLELAEEAVREQRRLAQELYDEDPEGEGRRALRTANLNQVSLDLAWCRHEEVIDFVDSVLADDSLYETASHARLNLLYNRGLAEHQLERWDPERESRARSTWERVVSSEPTEVLRREAHLALAEQSLLEGRFDAARRHLDQVPGDSGPRHTALVARWARLSEQPAEVLRARAAGLDREVDAMISSRRAEELRPGGAGLLQYVRNRVLLAERVAYDVELLGAEAALERYAAIQTATTLARRLEAPAPDAAAIRAALVDDDHGLLVFVPVVSGGSSVFAVDRHEVVHAPLPGYHRIEPLRLRWMEMLHRPAPLRPAEPELGRALAERVLPEEIRSRVRGWSRLTVTGLDSVPVALLPVGDSRLGALKAIDRWPSLPVGAALWKEPRERGEGASEHAPATPAVAFVADSTSPPEVQRRWRLDPLRRCDDVLDTIREVYGTDSVHDLRGEAASPLGFEALAERSPRVLQYLGHVVHDDQRPESGVLALSGAAPDTALLDCEDIRSFESSPGTVLLLACRSGSGRERLGDPAAADLAGAFLSARSRAVLVTGTDLSLGRGVELSRSLHPELARGTSLAEALRRDRARRFETLGDEALIDDGWVEVVGLGQIGVFTADELARFRSRKGATLVTVVSGLAAATLLAGLAVLAFRRTRAGRPAPSPRRRRRWEDGEAR